MTQSCWELLGIEPTSDEKVIKKAYAALLKQNKPDKNPEGFKQLREAYDEALNQRFWYAPDEDELLEDILADKTAADLQFDAKPLSASTLNTELKPIDYLQGDRLTHFSPVTTINDVQPVDNTDVSHDNNTQDAYGYEIPSANRLYTSDNGDIIDDIGFGNVDLDDEDLTAWTNLWQAQDDHQLAKVLQTQFAELDNQSLDFVHDYELELLQFLAYDDEPLVMSYKASFDYFNWQQYLNSWQAEQYPWSLLAHLHQRYPYLEKFLQSDMDLMLLQNYPNVHNYWRLQPFNRFNFVLNLRNIADLSIELTQLNDELDMVLRHQLIHDIDSLLLQKVAEYQEDSRLKMLNKWVFDKVFYFKDIPILAIIIAVVVILVSKLFLFDDWHYIVNNIGVIFTGMVVLLSFWQINLWFAAKPEKFTLNLDDPVLNRALLAVSALIFLSFYGQWYQHASLWATSLNQPSYFFAHLAGLSAWLLLVYAEQNKLILNTRMMASRAMILAVLAICIPLFAMSLGLGGENDKMAITPISPWLWWVYALPNIAYAVCNYEFVIRIAYGICQLVGFLTGVFLLVTLLNFHLLGFGLAGICLFLLGMWHVYWIKTNRFLQ